MCLYGLVTLMDRGFSLVELLVAMLIFAIGMLGLASLQGHGLQYNMDAYERSQAVFFAYDMSDRMRANIAGVNANAYAALAAPPNPLTSCVAANPVCDNAGMAAADASEWFTAIAAALPGGGGSVNCQDSDVDGDACTDGSLHRIRVTWTGKWGAQSLQVDVLP